MCLGIPGKIIQIHEGESLGRTGQVGFGGITKEVNLACVPEARVGQYVIVHVGFAISVVDESEAERVFEYLKVIDGLQELGEEKRGQVTGPNPSGDLSPFSEEL